VEELIWKLLPIGVLVVQGLFVWGMWSLSKKFVTCDACKAVHAEYDKQLAAVMAEGRALQGSLGNLATTDDLHEVALQVKDLGGGQEALRESIKSLGISIDRLDRPIQLLLDHHINGGGK